jgi:hypothetical protein
MATRLATDELEFAPEPPLEPAERYGLMAEFASATTLLQATRRAYTDGYRAMDAYSPFPVEGLSEALGVRQRIVPLIGLGGGIVGGLSGIALQYWIHVQALPINVGGRPLDSWQSFVPVTFELTVLFTALSLLVGLFVLNGHPEPYHPVFNVAAFARASTDRFFLAIEASDPHFDALRTRAFLEALGAREVADVFV